jgi:ABC-type transporter Mla subunit MlaD
MMPVSMRFGAVLYLALGVLAGPALAQAPMPPGAACLCLKQALDNASTDMVAKNSALAAARAELDQLDQQLSTMRSQVNINDPDAVARFRQLLEQRDVAAQRAGGPTLAESQAATAAYNDAVNSFNNQCGGRPLPPPPPGPLNCPMMR